VAHRPRLRRHQDSSHHPDFRLKIRWFPKILLPDLYFQEQFLRFENFLRILFSNFLQIFSRQRSPLSAPVGVDFKPLQAGPVTGSMPVFTNTNQVRPPALFPAAAVIAAPEQGGLICHPHEDISLVRIVFICLSVFLTSWLKNQFFFL
jgi:hypothetical protein